MPNTGSKREVASKLHRVLEVPGSEQTSPSQLRCVWHRLEVADGSLQEGGQTRKGRKPQPARRRVFIIQQPLKPDPQIDLVNSLANLQPVSVREEISAIPDAGGIVRARRRYGSGAGARIAASDDDTSGPRPSYKGKTR